MVRQGDSLLLLRLLFELQTLSFDSMVGGGLLNCVLVPGQEQTRQEEDIHKLQYDQQGNNNKLSCG